MRCPEVIKQMLMTTHKNNQVLNGTDVRELEEKTLSAMTTTI